MTTKIVLTGPESSGKTTLATALSAQLEAILVTEYARNYLLATDGFYEEKDLRTMAQGQLAAEQLALAGNPRFCICDTDLLVVEVWSEWKYGRCDPWIKEALMSKPGDLYILCDPGIPWEYDPLREHPEQRHELYAFYKQKLGQYGFYYIEAFGNEAERLTFCLEKISIFLG